MFTSLNVVSWQCIVGPALVLFARHIDMPASWVGVLLSFLPLTMGLVAVTAPLVVRVGPKRMMLSAWALRNIVVSAVFLTPWAIHQWGPRGGWFTLMGAILGFCVMRAVGSAGWFPWLHEVVDPEQYSLYFSAEISVVQVMNVGVTLGMAAALHGAPTTERYLQIFGVGIVAGLVSLIGMRYIPGGRGVEADVSAQWGFGPYRLALRDRRYLVFVVILVMCYIALTWFGAASILYMRDALKFSSRDIMAVMAMGSVGVFSTIRFWGRFAEQAGATQAMALGLTGHSLVAGACLFLPPGIPHVSAIMSAMVVFASIFGAAFGAAAHSAMLGYVRKEARVGYTNLWVLGTALSLGLTPILAGLAIDRLGLWGYRLCFGMGGGMGLVCAVCIYFALHRARRPDRDLVQFLNPGLPLRTLGRIVWITMGLHPSNRRGDKSRPHAA